MVGRRVRDEEERAYIKGEGDENDVDGNDVQQGQLNDCFLMAGISAVVRSHPYPDAFMRNLITDHGDGTYTVTFFDGDEPTGKRAVRVKATARLQGPLLLYQRKQLRQNVRRLQTGHWAEEVRACPPRIACR
jgi:hypothetical protein